MLSLAYQWGFVMTSSMEFATVHALTFQFNFYATLFKQCCSVAFNKPNKNVLIGLHVELEAYFTYET